jgi:diacylglycerol kinase family enzyme
MKPIFVINPLSESVAKKGSSLAALPSDVAAGVFRDDIFDRFDEIVAAGRKAGWVVIEGGDGTAQGIISAFFNRSPHITSEGVNKNLSGTALPKFTLLPGGMTNQVAKNIGLRTRKMTAVKRLLNGQHESLQTPLLRVSAQNHPDHYGFLFSSGGVPMVTQFTKDKIHSRGIGGSFAVCAGILRGISGQNSDVLSPTPIMLKRNDKACAQENHLGTLVTTLPSLLMGLDPFWGSGDGDLRVTYAQENPNHLARHVLSLWMGRKHKTRSQDGLHSWQAKTLDYDYNGPIVLDGEPLDIGSCFRVSSTPALTFLR